jgi:hypothetical protein
MDENGGGTCDPGSDRYWNWSAKAWSGLTDCVAITTSSVAMTPAPPDANVQWSTSTVSWTSGKNYVFAIYGKDAVLGPDGGANQSGASVRRFRIDTDPPASDVVSISSGAYYRDIASIGGTAADFSLFGGIGRVEIQIRNFGGDQVENGNDGYWDGTQFTVSTYVAAGFTGSSSGTWSYSTASVPWDAPRRYRISVRAADNGDNHEADKPGPIFSIDRSSPTAYLTQPANLSGFQAFPLITGTATDGMGLTDAGIVRSTYVQVAIQRLDDLRCWNGISWQSAGCHPLWEQAEFSGYSSGTWTYSAIPTPADIASGVSYLVLSRAIDNTLP